MPLDRPELATTPPITDVFNNSIGLFSIILLIGIVSFLASHRPLPTSPNALPSGALRCAKRWQCGFTAPSSCSRAVSLDSTISAKGSRCISTAASSARRTFSHRQRSTPGPRTTLSSSHFFRISPAHARFESWTRYDSRYHSAVSVIFVLLTFFPAGVMKSFLTFRTGNAWVHMWAFDAITPHVMVDTRLVVHDFNIRKSARQLALCAQKGSLMAAMKIMRIVLIGSVLTMLVQGTFAGKMLGGDDQAANLHEMTAKVLVLLGLCTDRHGHPPSIQESLSAMARCGQRPTVGG
jgi:hypothetical protein